MCTTPSMQRSVNKTETPQFVARSADHDLTSRFASLIVSRVGNDVALTRRSSSEVYRGILICIEKDSTWFKCAIMMVLMMLLQPVATAAG
jgi:hypothetical protein